MKIHLFQAWNYYPVHTLCTVGFVGIFDLSSDQPALNKPLEAFGTRVFQSAAELTLDLQHRLTYCCSDSCNQLNNIQFMNA